ncbi:MAG TPA: hypothetical protein PK360_16350, partial [bacterium]|nr:hypothetical protein [bacterium]
MGVAPGGEFTGAQLAEKTGVFDASGLGIGNIQGIGYLSNIQVFNLSQNNILTLARLVEMNWPEGTIVDVSNNPLTYRRNLREILVLQKRWGQMFVYTPQNSSYPIPPLSSLVSPWKSQDIGNVGIEGLAGMNASNTFAVSGSGSGLGGSIDGFHYVHQPFTGDCEMTTRVAHVGTGSEGILFRQSLEPDAPFVGVRATRANGILVQYRPKSASNTITLSTGKSFRLPMGLKLIRNEDNYEAYISNDNISWELLQKLTCPMNPSYYVGLAVTSENNTVTNESLIDQVSVRKYVYQPPTPTPAPTLTPTPVVFDPRPKTVIVTDSTQTREDLSGGYDQDADNERALVIRWNLEVPGAADYHVYVRVNQFKQAFFLGRTASGAWNYYEWRPGAPFLAPEFANGPLYGNHYTFIVYAIREGQNPVSAQTPGDVFFWSDKPLPTPTPTFTPTVP